MYSWTELLYSISATVSMAGMLGKASRIQVHEQLYPHLNSPKSFAAVSKIHFPSSCDVYFHGSRFNALVTQMDVLSAQQRSLGKRISLQKEKLERRGSSGEGDHLYLSLLYFHDIISIF